MSPEPITVEPERLFAKIGMLTIQVELLQQQLAQLAPPPEQSDEKP